MVVRFVPAEEHHEPRPDRHERELAEVIDFRSRLKEKIHFSDGGEKQNNLNSTNSAEELAEEHTVPLRLVRKIHATDRVSNNNYPVAADLSSVDSHEDEEQVAIPARTAYEDAVKILARRARSSGELSRELQRSGHSSLDVEIVIDEFNTRLYLDDVSLARTLTEKLRDSKGASRSHIRQKLRERLLSDETIHLVLEELDESEELELLRDAAFDRARKLGGLDRVTAERRLMGFLARRGWSGQLVHQVVREALDGQRPSRGVRFE